MQSTIRWMGAGTMRFVAQSGSGHLTTMDGAPEGGGENLAPRPMEVVLAGTGGCSRPGSVPCAGRACRMRDISRARRDASFVPRSAFALARCARSLAAGVAARQYLAAVGGFH